MHVLLSFSFGVETGIWLFLLLVDELNQTLAQVVEVKDLDIQNFDGPLDLRVHAVAILQGVVQVLLRVLDAALQL